MEYHKTQDLLHVMQFLGHRNIKNTLVYTQLINFENDDYRSATANTVQEAAKLIEAGFEYVCTYTNIMLFRKCKQTTVLKSEPTIGKVFPCDIKERSIFFSALGFLSVGREPIGGFLEGLTVSVCASCILTRRKPGTPEESYLQLAGNPGTIDAARTEFCSNEFQVWKRIHGIPRGDDDLPQIP